MLDLMPKSTTEEQQYARLMEIGLNMKQEKRSWRLISPEEKAYILSVASNTSVAGCMAGAIADALELKSFKHPIPVIQTSKRSYQNNTTGNGNVSAASMFSVYPNPTSGQLTITASEAGTLTFYGVVGNKIGSYKLNGGINTLHLPETIAAGLYTAHFTNTRGNKSDVIRIIYKP
jgi:hypothetical protein